MWFNSWKRFFSIGLYIIVIFVLTFVGTRYNIFVGTKMWGDEMGSKMGRPTQSPKNDTIKVRMSNEDNEKLDYCCQMTGKTKSDIIREGIDKVYNELKK